MKFSKPSLLILIFLLVFSFFSCGEKPCNSHVDANGDGECDVCGGEIKIEACAEHKDENGDGKCDTCTAVLEKKPEQILLIDKNGSELCANFQIVIPSNVSSSIVRAADFLVRDLEKLGLQVRIAEDTESTEQECEILIGDVLSRDDKYKIWRYDFGEKGYTVRIIDKKIIIQAGSDAKFEDAISSFKSNFLGITSSTKKLDRVSVLSNVEDTVIQDDYKVKKLNVLGEDMKGYKIAADKSNTAEYKAAEELQRYLYTTTGYYFEIVPSESAPESNIIVISKLAITGGLGFERKVSKGKIEFLCEYESSLSSNIINGKEFGNEVYEFFSEKIENSDSDTVNFDTGDGLVKNTRDVFYSDFGAVGDGATNDIEAIRACHTFANEFGHTVNADKGKHYYIGKSVSYVRVKTNVNWGDAKFTIDDRNIKVTDDGRGVAIFGIISDKSPITYTETGSQIIKDINAAGGIDAETCKKLDFGLGYPAMLKVTNTEHINYIRYGVNANDGEEQTEIIIVDKDGNIDPTTPFMFDYDKITSVEVYDLSDETLTIDGGIFTTRANQTADNSENYSYYGRGIAILRSNVTVKNLEHYVTDEPQGLYEGYRYSGFLGSQNASNILVTDCVFTAHTYYYSKNGSSGNGVPNGSYDISANFGNNIVWKNCTESNFYKADGITPTNNRTWGIMGASYVKNIAYEDSTLSRFDAHLGVYNAKVINCNVKDFRIVGSGEMIIENTKVYKDLIVSLREDYGGFWHGDILIKDTTIVGYSTANIFNNTWYNHDFGYQTAMPTNITVDNLKMTDINGNAYANATANLFKQTFVEQTIDIAKDTYDAELHGKLTNVNKMIPPKTITVKNNAQNISFNIPDKTVYKFFENTVIKYE